MTSHKKLGLVLATALALVLAAPGAAQAATTDSPPMSSAADTTDLSSQIANDPNLRYVSVAEAVEQFGFDPAAEAAGEANKVAPEATGPVSTPLNDWWGCGWDGKADYPHVTNGEASVHGYWVYNSGTCPSTADVTVNLQALGCTNVGCSWITQTTDTAVAVTPGSGTGHWATPHKRCANSNRVGWRGEVYVGLSNFWHPYGASYGAAVDLSCAPA